MKSLIRNRIQHATMNIYGKGISNTDDLTHCIIYRFISSTFIVLLNNPIPQRDYNGNWIAWLMKIENNSRYYWDELLVLPDVIKYLNSFKFTHFFHIFGKKCAAIWYYSQPCQLLCLNQLPFIHIRDCYFASVKRFFALEVHECSLQKIINSKKWWWSSYSMFVLKSNETLSTLTCLFNLFLIWGSYVAF